MIETVGRCDECGGATWLPDRLCMYHWRLKMIVEIIESEGDAKTKAAKVMAAAHAVRWV